MIIKIFKYVMFGVAFLILIFVGYIFYIMKVKKTPTHINKELEVYFKNLSNNKPSLLILFSPDCGPCLVQTKNIYLDRANLTNFNVLLASTKDSTNTHSFFNSITSNWDRDMSNIGCIYNSLSKISSYCTEAGLPKIYIFDKNGKLKYKYNTAIPTDSIIAKSKK